MSRMCRLIWIYTVHPRITAVSHRVKGKSLCLEQDILCSVMIKNLDTGEMVPLKEAEQKLPKCVDPLVLHIMERTHEYPG
jgi:hypothetical protein